MKIPVNALPGDPIIDLNLKTLDGRPAKLDQVLDSSFCFFLSTGCPACKDALPVLEQAFDDHHVVLVFVEESAETATWVRSQNFSFDTYLVKSKDLEPFNIKTLPALLAYRDQKLKFGFHGVINAHKCQRMRGLFESH